MKKVAFLVTLALSALFLVSAAMAGDVADACKEDVAKHCKRVLPGKGRVFSCLKGASDKVSQGCKDAIEARKEELKKFADDCKVDLAEHCKAVPAGGGRKISCLEGAKDKLEPSCKAHFENGRPKMEDADD